jgi:hypothetical protein
MGQLPTLLCSQSSQRWPLVKEFLECSGKTAWLACFCETAACSLFSERDLRRMRCRHRSPYLRRQIQAYDRSSIDWIRYSESLLEIFDDLFLVSGRPCWQYNSTSQLERPPSQGNTAVLYNFLSFPWSSASTVVKIPNWAKNVFEGHTWSAS